MVQKMAITFPIPVFRGLRECYTVFKELTPRFRTYELRGQGKREGRKRNVPNQDKPTPHTLLQKLSPKMYNTPLSDKLKLKTLFDDEA